MTWGREWRGWSARSQVERVDLYTRQSLHILLWALNVLVLIRLAPESSDHPGEVAAVVVFGLVLTGAGSVTLHDVVNLWPRRGPLPWRSLGPFLLLEVVGVLGMLTLPRPVRTEAALLLCLVAIWCLSGLRSRPVAGLLLLGATFAPWLMTRQPFFALFGLLTVLFCAFTVRASLWLYGVVTQLDDARGAQAALAVAEERLRFSRDVHDILGRRLSAISVQSELAAALARRGDAGAARQMLEVRGVAHDALREARELARGYRPTDLAQELDGARSLLRSAGIDVDLDVRALPPGWHEAAGWVIREAVTNVLRHSAATSVRIAYDAPTLAVRNDRPVSAPSAHADGSGLAGLRERLAPLGADLAVDHRAAEFAVVATFPGQGPGAPS